MQAASQFEASELYRTQLAVPALARSGPFPEQHLGQQAQLACVANH